MEPTFCVRMTAPPDDVLEFVRAARNPESHALLTRNGITLALCHFRDKYSVLSVRGVGSTQHKEYGKSIGFRGILRETLVRYSILSHLDIPKVETWLDDTPICKRPKHESTQSHGNPTHPGYRGGSTGLPAYPHPPSSSSSGSKRARDPDTCEGEEDTEPSTEELPELLTPTHVRTKHYSGDGENKLRYVIKNIPKPTGNGD